MLKDEYNTVLYLRVSLFFFLSPPHMGFNGTLPARPRYEPVSVDDDGAPYQVRQYEDVELRE